MEEIDLKSNLKYSKVVERLSSISTTEFPKEAFAFRNKIRNKTHLGGSEGQCLDYLQVNAVLIPSKYDEDLINFFKLNAKPLPLLGFSKIKENQPQLPNLCPLGLDFLSDIGKYYIKLNGITQYKEFTSDEVKQKLKDEKIDVNNFSLWTAGCSFTFDSYLTKLGWNIKHVQKNKVLALYKTNIDVVKYGVFQKGKVVVSMRPIKKNKIQEIMEIGARFFACHGTPVYYGNEYTKYLGIENLNQPDIGDYEEIEPDELPVFWACGGTLFSVLDENNIDFVFCGATNLLVTDRKIEDIIDL